MFIIDNTLITIARILGGLLSLYSFVIIISAVLSWVNPDPYNPIVRTLRALTEPVYDLIRRFIPFTNLGGLDITPIIVLILIQLIEGSSLIITNSHLRSFY